MKIAQIFNNLAETNFLEILAQEKNLVFIGDAETIAYLQNYFASTKILTGNYYFVWNEQSEQSLINNRSGLHDRRAIIVASVRNENELFENIKTSLAQLKIELPILRLFADAFVNLNLGRDLIDGSEYLIKKPKISYAILTTPRSGSTFLCAALQSTKIAGLPTEHLRQASAVLAQNCHFDYLRYLQLISSYKITKNEVFGTKIISHFLQVFQKSPFNFADLFTQYFSKFVYLIRRDKVAQAVSIFLAQTTNIWHISSEQQIQDYQRQLEQITIEDNHLEVIHQHYLFLLKEEEYLEKLFKIHAISPLIMEYEQLVENQETEINRLLDYLEIDRDREQIHQISSHIKKLPSTLSTKLIEAYQEKKLGSRARY
jgi:LPS sulfotransferase NodH